MLTPDNLKEARRLLPPEEAEILWDVYHHKMSLHSVARKMGLAPQRLQVIHARALKTLRRRMQTGR